MYSNFATNSGGGAHTCTLTNCTVTANSALTLPAGVLNCVSRNSIVYGHAPAGPTANWVGGTFERSCTTPLPAGVGNLALDPLLQTSRGYRLGLGSPCREAGDNAFVDPASTTDLYGNARISHGTVDLGAHELSLLVTTTADTGLGSLRATLADFAGSTETPTITFHPSLAGQTFLFLNGSVVFDQPGGFVLDANALASRPLLLAGPGVRLFELRNGTLTLRGFRLSSTTPPIPGGGGLYQTGGTSTIEDCIFDHHLARSGAAILHQTGSMTVNRCTFTDNRATATGISNGGGAIAAYSVGLFTASDCVFEGNSADTSGPPGTVAYGGAISLGGGSWSISRCSFTNNTADLGGALSSVGNFVVSGQVSGCTFEGNTARRQGGAIQNNAVLSLTRCTLSGNTALEFGGALQNTGAAVTLTHCTVSGNFAPSSPGIDSQQGSAALTLAYCILTDNLSTGGGGDYNVFHVGSSTLVGANLVGATYFSTPPGGSGNLLNGPGGLGPLGFYGGPTKTRPLAADSPARDAGSGSPSASDQRGYPIVGLPDLGAYESGTYSDFVVWIYEQLPAAATLAEHDAAFDFDGDGQTNFEEWLSLSDPNRAASRFAATAALNAGAPAVSFPSAAGRVYRLQQSDTLLSWIDAPVSPLAGDGSLKSFVLPAPGTPKRFYRVQAALP